MSSTESNSSEPAPPARGGGPAPNAIALVVVTLGLLGWLVWASRPARPALVPASVQPLPPPCSPKAGEFVPSNFTEVRGVSLDGLSTRQRNRVLLRLNMEVCPCGCNVSLAECLNSHPHCSACPARAEGIVKEERGTS